MDPDPFLEPAEAVAPVVVATIGGETYDIVRAIEIVAAPEITLVPGTKPGIRGVMILRGDVEVVLDVRTLLGLPRIHLVPRCRVVMVERDGVRAGLLVDSVEDVAGFPPDHPLDVERLLAQALSLEPDA